VVATVQGPEHISCPGASWWRQWLSVHSIIAGKVLADGEACMELSVKWPARRGVCCRWPGMACKGGVTAISCISPVRENICASLYCELCSLGTGTSMPEPAGTVAAATVLVRMREVGQAGWVPRSRLLCARHGRRQLVRCGTWTSLGRTALPQPEPQCLAGYHVVVPRM